MSIAVYIPTWEGALGALPAQVLLISGLVCGLSLYLRQRYSATVTTVTIAAGLHAGAIGGLALFGLRAGSLADLEAVALAYIDLRVLCLASIVGLVLSWLILEGAARITDRGADPVPVPDTRTTPPESRHCP